MTQPSLGVAAVRTAQRLGPNHTVVTILCDSGMRHLSKFWADAGDVGGKTDVQLADILGPQVDHHDPAHV